VLTLGLKAGKVGKSLQFDDIYVRHQT